MRLQEHVHGEDLQKKLAIPDPFRFANNSKPDLVTPQYVGQGAYVDMGYGYDPRFQLSITPPVAIGMFPAPVYATAASSGPPRPPHRSKLDAQGPGKE